MRLHQVWFLIWLRFLLGFAEFLDQAHGLALETAVESAAGAGVDDIAKLFGGEVEESVDVICVSGGKDRGWELEGTHWSRSMPR